MSRELVKAIGQPNFSVSKAIGWRESVYDRGKFTKAAERRRDHLFLYFAPRRLHEFGRFERT
jgi:hypothetical protein